MKQLRNKKNQVKNISVPIIVYELINTLNKRENQHWLELSEKTS